MTTYAVLAPNDPARSEFIPDSFSRAAFIFGPLWLLRHRVWRGLIGYVTILVLFTWALRWLQLPLISFSPVAALLGLYIGLEGQALRRAALERRGFRLTDIVVSPSRDHAETVYFSRWQNAAEAAAPPPPAAAPTRPAPRATDVIGLFPEAGGGR